MELKVCYDRIKGELAQAGIEAAGFEARQLLRQVTGLDDAGLLLGEEQLSARQWEQLEALCQRRCAGYPLQYLLGEWEFYGLPFFVGEGVLIPRQDTETLCEWVIGHFSGRSGLKIMDLCTGSGCIAITLDQYLPGNQIWAMERSERAAEYCRRNISRHHSGVRLLVEDALRPETQETGFDLIVSNPPYLTGEEMRQLQREVAFEPQEALFAEENGLYFYRQLTRVWLSRLKPGGVLVYEVGAGQSREVCGILEHFGLDLIDTRQDLGGIERIVLGVKPWNEEKEEEEWR